MARDANSLGPMTAISVEKSFIAEINELIKSVHELNFMIEVMCDDAFGATPEAAGAAPAETGYGQIGQATIEIRNAKTRVHTNLDRLVNFRNRIGVSQ